MSVCPIFLALQDTSATDNEYEQKLNTLGNSINVWHLPLRCLGHFGRDEDTFDQVDHVQLYLKWDHVSRSAASETPSTVPLRTVRRRPMRVHPQRISLTTSSVRTSSLMSFNMKSTSGSWRQRIYFSTWWTLCMYLKTRYKITGLSSFIIVLF